MEPIRTDKDLNLGFRVLNERFIFHLRVLPLPSEYLANVFFKLSCSLYQRKSSIWIGFRQSLDMFKYCFKLFL